MERSETLIRHAEINGECHDVLISRGRVFSIADPGTLTVSENTPCVEAQGGLLVPGLTDHHLHLYATAAAMSSVRCGPPEVANAEQLSIALKVADETQQPSAWLRGIGYHDSVAGEIDRQILDQLGPDRPIRIQHRGGRLWVLNSSAISMLGLDELDGSPGERDHAGRLTGRFLEADEFLTDRMALIGQASNISLSDLSSQLARFGITAVTDTSPRNTLEQFRSFQQSQRSGELKQRLRMMGDASLDEYFPSQNNDLAKVGEHKFHLLESQLPDWQDTVEAMQTSHAFKRPVAIHCVTVAELAFAVSALEAAGVMSGDRIEHASVVPPEWMQKLAELAKSGLRVVTQSVLIVDRGDQYLQDVALEDQPWLYRLAGFQQVGIPLAGSSDAPYGSINPWLGMQAAVDRKTAAGQVISAIEGLTPEAALGLYLSVPDNPGGVPQHITEGGVADLCLLPAAWQEIRTQLGQVEPCYVWRDGQLISGE